MALWGKKIVGKNFPLHCLNWLSDKRKDFNGLDNVRAKLTLGDKLRSTSQVDMELTAVLEGATPLDADTGGTEVPGKFPDSFSSALGMG